jgi:hypothetical protein
MTHAQVLSGLRAEQRSICVCTICSSHSACRTISGSNSTIDEAATATASPFARVEDPVGSLDEVERILI